MTRLRVISASGTRPPHMPECTAWVSVRTSTSARTRPRRLVVSAGSPMSQLPESAITITSARSRSWYFVSSSRRVTEPTSSSPSMNMVTFTGRSSPKTRIAPRWAAMPALSSAAPRPYRRRPLSESRSVGSNGGLSHSAGSFSGCTSWWA